MKFKKLLVLSALWLVGLNASAVLTLEREKPVEPSSAVIDLSTIEQTPADFVVGDYYVIYNVGAQKFLYEGNAWGTQASVSAENAQLVYFALPNGKTLADKQLYLRDFSPVKNAWHTAFIAKDGKVVGAGYEAGLFIDNADGTAALLWVEACGDKTYHISIAEENSALKPEGKIFAVEPEAPGIENGEAGSVINVKKTVEDAGAYGEWQFFSVAEWNEYAKLAAVYNASEELRKTIEGAPDYIDVAPYEAVYNNADATAEQLLQAKADLEEAMKNSVVAQLANATGTNPVDVTELINNPDFKNASIAGWTTAVGNVGWGYPAEQQKLAEVPEFYNTNYNFYQELDIAGGVYELQMYGFYRAGNTQASLENYLAGTNKNAFLYAGTDIDTMQVALANPFKNAPKTNLSQGVTNSGEATAGGFYIPNNLVSAGYHFQQGRYNNVLFFDANDSKMRIGIKKETTVAEDWTTFDAFRLKYYGKGADAYAAWAKGGFQPIDTEAESFLGTKAVAQNFNNMIANATATNREEAMACMAQLEAELAVVEENISAWNDLNKLYLEVKDFLEKNADNSAEEVAALKKYIGTTRSGLARDMTRFEMSTAEVKAAQAKLQELYDAAKKAKPLTGADVTYKLTNPDFSTGTWEGWTKENAAGGNVQVNNSCGEAWNNASFDIRQEVADMPVGVYEISAQGFYRYGRGDAWTAWNEKQVEYVIESPCYIYMNDNMTPFVNVFSELVNHDETIYSSGYTTYTDPEDESIKWDAPNDMASAAQAFAKGMYTQSAFGAVVNAGEIMKLGVKGSSNQAGDSWVIFDNFKLTYWGTEAAKVNQALKAAIEECTARLEKVESPAAQKKLEDALAAANAAVDGTDGDAMFQVLADLYKAKNYEYELNQKIQSLKDAIAGLSAKLSGLASDELLATVVEEYNSALDVYNDNVTNGDEIDFEAAEADIKKMGDEVSKYQELEDAYNRLTTAVEEADASQEDWAREASVLLDGISTKLSVGTAAMPVSAIDAAIEDIEAKLTEQRKPAEDMSKATDAAPVDATSYIQSAKFEKAAMDDEGNIVQTNAIEGWKNTEGYNFGNDNNQKAALEVEFFNKTFDMYQDLTGIPNGTYEIQVNAFYRFGSTDQDNESFVNSPDTVTNVFLYGISAQDTSAVSVAMLRSGMSAEKLVTDSIANLVKDGEMWLPSEAPVTVANAEDNTKKDTIGWVPNDMASTKYYFDAGKYLNKVVVKVTNGKLRLGIKQTAIRTSNADWVIMDNFKLLYYGENSAKQADPNYLGIDLVADEAAPVVRTEFFTLNGVRTLAPQKGVSIMRQTLSNGNVIVKKIRN